MTAPRGRPPQKRDTARRDRIHVILARTRAAREHIDAFIAGIDVDAAAEVEPPPITVVAATSTFEISRRPPKPKVIEDDPPARKAVADARRVYPLSVVVDRYLAYALEQHGGNMSRAARDLGIYRQTLQRRIRQMEALRAVTAEPAP